MELIWFLLGLLAMAMIWGVQFWTAKKAYHPSALTWSAIGMEIFLILFTLAWVVSSIEEGESQAAAMGMLFIGGCALVLFALIRKAARKEMLTKMECSEN